MMCVSILKANEWCLENVEKSMFHLTKYVKGDKYMK